MTEEIDGSLLGASFLWAIGLVRIPKDLEAGQQLDIARMVVLGLIGARCLGRTGELPPLLNELFTRDFLVVETSLYGYSQNPDRSPTAGLDIECRDSIGGGHEKLRCEQYWKKGHE